MPYSNTLTWFQKSAESETHDLPREQKLALLKQLRKGLKLLHAQLLQAEAAPAMQVPSHKLVSCLACAALYAHSCSSWQVPRCNFV